MMAQHKQAFAWWCFDRLGIAPEQLIQAAVTIGYDAIEMPPRDFWPAIHDQGLQIASIAGHQSIEAGLNRRDQHDRIEHELRDNLELAATWQIPNLICFSGSRNGLDDAAGVAITAEGLRRVTPIAETLGVTLVLELLNSKIDHPDYQCDHTAWGVAVCRAVGSPRLKLLYDVYHMQIMEGDIIRTIREHHALIGHYHTAGVPGRHEIDAGQELNYAAIFRAIRETGYTGYIGHEFIPVGEPLAGLQAAFDLTR